jgi:hypothetical protein
LAEQLGGLHPAPLQSLEVPPHTCWIAHAAKLAYVSILCKYQ